MSKLIKNEFKKLFSKKLMLILFIIAIAFTILTNVLYNMEDPFDNKKYLEEELSYLEEELKTLDYKSQADNSYYIDLKTQYDLIKLSLNYDSESWQYNYINSSDIVYTLRNINENIYGINKDEQKLVEAQKEFNTIKTRLNSGDWKSFAQEQIEDKKEEIAFYEEQLKNISDKKTIEELNTTIETAKANKQALEWRLEKEIPYDNSFLSGKIEEYTNSFATVESLKDKENKTKEEEQDYNLALKQMNTSKYYIENNINIENEYDGRYILINLTQEYGMFILIFSVIVAGTIVSNEFQKGTIKLLLTRPYSRNKILLSKYIVSIISIFIFIILFALLQYFVGGIVSGFNAFNVPVVEYDIGTNSIVVMSVFKYLIIIILSNLPIYILTSTLAFALSTITMNSAVSIAIPILGNMVSELINLFIEKVKILKYFVTANWDLSVYLFGGKGLAEGLNFKLSLAICIIYLAIMIITVFIVFNKRDIKNV